MLRVYKIYTNEVYVGSIIGESASMVIKSYCSQLGIQLYKVITYGKCNKELIRCNKLSRTGYYKCGRYRKCSGYKVGISSIGYIIVKRM